MDRQRRSHRIAVTLLLVLGTILTPLTIIALFTHTQITDTNRYVENVTPLASDPAVQAYVTDDITNRLIGAVDVEAYLKDLLPARLAPIAGPVSTAFTTFVHEATEKFVTSDQFKTLWIEANRRVHAALVKVLTGEHSDAIVQGPKGLVSIDLSVVVQKVLQALDARGITLFDRIPAAQIGRQIPIFQSDQLYKARKAVGLLDKLALILPFLVVGCFGAAIWLSRNRRRGFIKAAICFAIGALVLAIGLKVGRGAYLNAVTSELPHDAAATIYDTLLRFLTTSVRAVGTVSVIVVIAAFFSGPSRLATWFRWRVRHAAWWLGQQSDGAGWGWLGRSAPIARAKTGIRIAIAVVAFAVVFFWKHPTPADIFWVAVAALALLVLVEFFGRDEREPQIEVSVSVVGESPDPVPVP